MMAPWAIDKVALALPPPSCPLSIEYWRDSTVGRNPNWEAPNIHSADPPWEGSQGLHPGRAMSMVVSGHMRKIEVEFD